jgi:hypothetical protein
VAVVVVDAAAVAVATMIGRAAATTTERRFEARSPASGSGLA